MRTLSLTLATLALLAFGTPDAARAQSYSFSVPLVTMECTINTDASVRIHYRIEFQNSSWGSPIDVVDVGLPHDQYDIRNMRAWLDGEEMTSIATSTYIDTGVEVHLGAGIPAGAAGVFEFETTVPDMVFSDTTDDALASMRITPTWFDDNLVTGDTDLRIAIHLPPGVDAESVVHQGTPFYNKADLGDHALVGFRFENTRFTEAHLVGISFPREVMTRVVEITKWDLLVKWWEDSPGTRIIVGVLMLLVALLFFMRFTGFTGWSVFIFCAGAAGVLFFFSPVAQLYAIPIVVVVAGLLEWRTQKRKRTYLPPIASVEGGGIKRGLTAPEAAVLLELPLGRVLTLVIFGMLRKGLITQKALKPLTVELAPAIAQAKKHKARRRAAAHAGLVIHGYEHAFIDAIQDSRGLAVNETDFGIAMKKLVEHVAERVLGFDVDETRKYYRYQIQRAWTEAETIGELDMRTKKVDEKLEWLLMDDDYDDRFSTWGTAGYWYRPTWGYGHVGTGTIDAGAGAVADAAASVGGGALDHTQTSFGDVAAGFAGWTERVTGQLSNAIRPGDVTAAASGGVVDLSGADKVTGDVLEAFFSSSGGGGGGGGGGCACACAGCACACACAGGGR
jgi:hypothetical protein